MHYPLFPLDFSFLSLLSFFLCVLLFFWHQCRSGPLGRRTTTGSQKNSNSSFEKTHEKHLWGTRVSAVKVFFVHLDFFSLTLSLSLCGASLLIALALFNCGEFESTLRADFRHKRYLYVRYVPPSFSFSLSRPFFVSTPQLRLDIPQKKKEPREYS